MSLAKLPSYISVVVNQLETFDEKAAQEISSYND